MAENGGKDELPKKIGNFRQEKEGIDARKLTNTGPRYWNQVYLCSE